MLLLQGGAFLSRRRYLPPAPKTPDCSLFLCPLAGVKMPIPPPPLSCLAPPVTIRLAKLEYSRKHEHPLFSRAYIISVSSFSYSAPGNIKCLFGLRTRNSPLNYAFAEGSVTGARGCLWRRPLQAGGRHTAYQAKLPSSRATSPAQADLPFEPLFPRLRAGEGSGVPVEVLDTNEAWHRAVGDGPPIRPPAGGDPAVPGKKIVSHTASESGPTYRRLPDARGPYFEGLCSHENWRDLKYPSGKLGYRGAFVVVCFCDSQSCTQTKESLSHQPGSQQSTTAWFHAQSGLLLLTPQPVWEQSFFLKTAVSKDQIHAKTKKQEQNTSTPEISPKPCPTSFSPRPRSPPGRS